MNTSSKIFNDNNFEWFFIQTCVLEIAPVSLIENGDLVTAVRPLLGVDPLLLKKVIRARAWFYKALECTSLFSVLLHDKCKTNVFVGLITC